MKCREVIRELSGYLDGELTPEAMAELDRHLGHCEDCRLVVDTVRKTIDIYCKAEPVPLPDDVRSRLHDALAKRLLRKPSI